MSNFSSVRSEFVVGDTWVEIRNPKRTMEIKGHVSLDGLPNIVFVTESGITHVRRPADVKSGWKPAPKFVSGDEIFFAKSVDGDRFFYVSDQCVIRIPAIGSNRTGGFDCLAYYIHHCGVVTGSGCNITDGLCHAKAYIK